MHVSVMFHAGVVRRWKLSPDRRLYKLQLQSIFTDSSIADVVKDSCSDVSVIFLGGRD